MIIKNINSFLTVALLNTCLVIGQEPSIKTNFTRSYLSKNILDVKCNSTDECPLYSKCNEEINSCYYGNFFCTDEEDLCVYVNTTIWSIENEMIRYEYSKLFNKKSYKPFLKACDKDQVDLKTCKTDRCRKNDDCYSGKCYEHTCITDKMIYICSGEKSYNGTNVCLKNGEMRCSLNSECYSDKCDDGYCKFTPTGNPELEDDINTTARRALVVIILVTVIGIIAFIVVIYKCIKKTKDDNNNET